MCARVNVAMTLEYLASGTRSVGVALLPESSTKCFYRCGNDVHAMGHRRMYACYAHLCKPCIPPALQCIRHSTILSVALFFVRR